MRHLGTDQHFPERRRYRAQGVVDRAHRIAAARRLHRLVLRRTQERPGLTRWRARAAVVRRACASPAVRIYRTSMRPRRHERHKIGETGWLRASVLGANDGVVSTSSLILGV